MDMDVDEEFSGRDQENDEERKSADNQSSSGSDSYDS